MGVQEGHAQVEPALPEPVPEPLAVYREWVCREGLFLEKGQKEG